MPAPPPEGHDPTLLARYLRYRLGQLGLSPRALSRRAGLGANTVRQLLYGRRPRAQTLDALAPVLAEDPTVLRWLAGYPVRLPHRPRLLLAWVLRCRTVLALVAPEPLPQPPPPGPPPLLQPRPQQGDLLAQQPQLAR